MVSSTSPSPVRSVVVAEVLVAEVVGAVVDAVAVRPRLARLRKQMALVLLHLPQVAEVAVVAAQADRAVADVVLLRLRVRNLRRVGCSSLFWTASPS
jgi:hypothetical protein